MSFNVPKDVIYNFRLNTGILMYEPNAFNSETDNFKLLYGGHQYHASCANFWINCVEPKPPGLILPDLL